MSIFFLQERERNFIGIRKRGSGSWFWQNGGSESIKTRDQKAHKRKTEERCSPCKIQPSLSNKSSGYLSRFFIWLCFNFGVSSICTASMQSRDLVNIFFANVSWMKGLLAQLSAKKKEVFRNVHSVSYGVIFRSFSISLAVSEEHLRRKFVLTRLFPVSPGKQKQTTESWLLSCPARLLRWKHCLC